MAQLLLPLYCCCCCFHCRFILLVIPLNLPKATLNWPGCLWQSLAYISLPLPLPWLLLLFLFIVFTRARSFYPRSSSAGDSFSNEFNGRCLARCCNAIFLLFPVLSFLFLSLRPKLLYSSENTKKKNEERHLNINELHKF